MANPGWRRRRQSPENESATPARQPTTGDGAYVRKPPAETARRAVGGLRGHGERQQLAVGIDLALSEPLTKPAGSLLAPGSCLTFGSGCWKKRQHRRQQLLRSDRPPRAGPPGRGNRRFTFRRGDQRPTGNREALRRASRYCLPERLVRQRGREIALPAETSTGISTFRWMPGRPHSTTPNNPDPQCERESTRPVCMR